jgi:hypothetical protein
MGAKVQKKQALNREKSGLFFVHYVLGKGSAFSGFAYLSVVKPALPYSAFNRAIF